MLSVFTASQLLTVSNTNEQLPRNLNKGFKDVFRIEEMPDVFYSSNVLNCLHKLNTFNENNFKK